jgi:hypothetical protein
MKNKKTKLETLILFVEGWANENYGGHYTIFSFTSCYKFSFGTINEREDIEKLLPYDSLEDAIINAIQSEFSKLNSK